MEVGGEVEKYKLPQSEGQVVVIKRSTHPRNDSPDLADLFLVKTSSLPFQQIDLHGSAEYYTPSPIFQLTCHSSSSHLHCFLNITF